MQCPYCQGDAAVLDSRTNAEGVRRRRSCNDCKRRFTTYERVAAPAIKVIKRAGKNEAFDSNKITEILLRIGRHRFDKVAATRLAHAIEAQLLDEQVKSIRSGELASRLLDKLRTLDRLSYDRLAANYMSESGVLKTSPSTETSDPDQLVLFKKP